MNAINIKATLEKTSKSFGKTINFIIKVGGEGTRGGRGGEQRIFPI